MVILSRFISDVLSCLGWPYVCPGGTGKDCSRSGIDCSGLLVRAYKLQGESLYHGSNYIARYEVVGNTEQLIFASQLQPGMAVFKWRRTGEPDRYKRDGKGDFHHIGVVTSVSPLTITHASSAKGKVVQDTSIKAWTHFGRLKSISYEEDTTVRNSYKVTAPSGTTVNMRQSTSTTSDVLVKVPVGADVPGIPCTTEGWTKVEYMGVTGYMMRKFLDKKEDSPSIEERLESVEKQLAELREILKGGAAE